MSPRILSLGWARERFRRYRVRKRVFEDDRFPLAGSALEVLGPIARKN